MSHTGKRRPATIYIGDPLQIIPANGWKAVFYEEGKLERLPLVYWALAPVTLDDETDMQVVGLVLLVEEGASIPQVPNTINSFLGYEPPTVEWNWSEWTAMKDREVARQTGEKQQ